MSKYSMEAVLKEIQEKAAAEPVALRVDPGLAFEIDAAAVMRILVRKQYYGIQLWHAAAVKGNADALKTLTGRDARAVTLREGRALATPPEIVFSDNPSAATFPRITKSLLRVAENHFVHALEVAQWTPEEENAADDVAGVMRVFKEEMKRVKDSDGVVVVRDWEKEERERVLYKAKYPGDHNMEALLCDSSQMKRMTERAKRFCQNALTPDDIKHLKRMSLDKAKTAMFLDFLRRRHPNYNQTIVMLQAIVNGDWKKKKQKRTAPVSQSPLPPPPPPRTASIIDLSLLTSNDAKTAPLPTTSQGRGQSLPARLTPLQEFMLRGDHNFADMDGVRAIAEQAPAMDETHPKAQLWDQAYNDVYQDRTLANARNPEAFFTRLRRFWSGGAGQDAEVTLPAMAEAALALWSVKNDMSFGEAQQGPSPFDDPTNDAKEERDGKEEERKRPRVNQQASSAPPPSSPPAARQTPLDWLAAAFQSVDARAEPPRVYPTLRDDMRPSATRQPITEADTQAFLVGVAAIQAIPLTVWTNGDSLDMRNSLRDAGLVDEKTNQSLVRDPRLAHAMTMRMLIATVWYHLYGEPRRGANGVEELLVKGTIVGVSTAQGKKLVYAPARQSVYGRVTGSEALGFLLYGLPAVLAARPMDKQTSPLDAGWWYTIKAMQTTDLMRNREYQQKLKAALSRIVVQATSPDDDNVKRAIQDNAERLWHDLGMTTLDDFSWRQTDRREPLRQGSIIEQLTQLMIKQAGTGKLTFTHGSAKVKMPMSRVRSRLIQPRAAATPSARRVGRIRVY
jgi:hypothetical protein